VASLKLSQLTAHHVMSTLPMQQLIKLRWAMWPKERQKLLKHTQLCHQS